MTAERPSLDRIVDDLLNGPQSREDRKRLLRELVRRGAELPDEILEEALQRMMRRLADDSSHDQAR